MRIKVKCRDCFHSSKYFDLVEKSLYRFRCSKCKSTANGIYVDKGDDVLAVLSSSYKTPDGFISRQRLISHLVDAMGSNRGFSYEWYQSELEKPHWSDYMIDEIDQVLAMKDEEKERYDNYKAAQKIEQSHLKFLKDIHDDDFQETNDDHFGEQGTSDEPKNLI